MSDEATEPAAEVRDASSDVAPPAMEERRDSPPPSREERTWALVTPAARTVVAMMEKRILIVGFLGVTERLSERWFDVKRLDDAVGVD